MGWLKRLFSTPKLDLPDQRATREPREPARSQTRRTPARVTPTRREPDWRSYDWEDVAEAYAKVLAPMMTEPYRDLLALAGRTDASRSVLDIGAGTGEELTGLDGLVVGV